ncbi:MAG: FAD:protein FMN transferase [Clostridiales bacterium]|nr:FAD:protein FMN transferase [Clostridiales bacterium]
MKKFVAGLLCAVVWVFALSGCTQKLKDYYIYTNIQNSEFTVLAPNYRIEQVIPADNSFSGGKAENTRGFTAKSKYFSSMNTDAVLTVYADFSVSDAVQSYIDFTQAVTQTLTDIENSLSVTNGESSAQLFNRAEAGETVEVDKTFYEVLQLAKQMYEFTDGYYNPAVYYSVSAYGFDIKEQPDKLPKDEDIAKFTELYKEFENLEFTEDSLFDKYSVKKPEKTVEVDGVTYSLKVDLGGIGKGYATDIINEMFQDYGFEYGLFNFGGSSLSLKKHYSKGDFTLELIEPRRNSTHYLSFNVHDICVSSSGDYVNYYTVNGVRYCHIIDPATGKPVQTGIMSATVAGGSAAENDAITTAIMAMGRDRAISFIESKLTDKYAVFTYDKFRSAELAKP